MRIDKPTAVEAVIWRGTTSGLITIQATAAAGTYTLTLPPDDGTPGQFLQTDGSGVLTWVTPTSPGTGTVTSVSIVTANGISGSVATATTTPAITLTLGAITPTTVNGNTITTGTGTLTLNTFTLTVAGNGSVSGTNTGDQTTISGNAGSASTATIVDDTTTNAVMYPIWVTTTTGNLPLKVSSTKLNFNPSTGTLSSTGFTPIANDGAALGTTSLNFSDLFLASGAVINWANGNVALTQTSGILTLGTGTLKITTPTNTTTSVVTIDGTQTLTNKRINPRIVSAASYTTDTGTSLDVATTDEFVITAQAGALLFNNPSGTPTEGQKLIIRIKDNGTARALTYGTQFRAMGNALPTTTVLSKTLYMGFIYNITDTKWDLVAVAQEA